MPTRDLAVELATNPFKGHKLLLDGQQRLTSLTAILSGQPINIRGKKRPIEILFNLDHPEGPPIEVVEVNEGSEEGEAEEEEDVGPNPNERLKLRTFIVANKALLNDARWVRVSDLFNPAVTDAQLLKKLVKSFEDPLFDKYSTL